jgi:hypothetical protein
VNLIKHIRYTQFISVIGFSTEKISFIYALLIPFKKDFGLKISCDYFPYFDNYDYLFSFDNYNLGTFSSFLLLYEFFLLD